LEKTGLASFLTILGAKGFGQGIPKGGPGAPEEDKRNPFGRQNSFGDRISPNWDPQEALGFPLREESYYLKGEKI